MSSAVSEAISQSLLATIADLLELVSRLKMASVASTSLATINVRIGSRHRYPYAKFQAHPTVVSPIWRGLQWTIIL